jgi:hypothetical protein
MSTPSSLPARRGTDSLADVLERVLDKGIVIVGDVIVNVLDIELLSLKLRLFISSAETAKEMGMDWWTTDPFFSSQAQPKVESDDDRRSVHGDDDEQRGLRRENDELRRQIAELQRAMNDGGGRRAIPGREPPPRRRTRDER